MEKFIINRKDFEKALIEFKFAKQRGVDIRDSLELLELILNGCDKHLFQIK